MTTKKSARLRTTIHVPESKKSRTPPKRLSSLLAASGNTEPPRSEQQLPDEIPGGKRNPDDREHHDGREREDAEPLYERPHGTCPTGRNGDPREGIATR